MELLMKDGRLHWKRDRDPVPVMKIGENRFSITPPGAPAPQEFVLGLDKDGRPVYMHMFLWAFARVLGNP